MSAFPSFLIYIVTAGIVAAYGVQGVLLQHLSTAETVLYCTARVLIVFASGLFAALMYRRFRDSNQPWYKRLAALVMLAGSLYSMTETFLGRAAVSINSYQHQSADLSESAAKVSAAQALAGSAQALARSADAHSAASTRLESSTRRNAVDSQLNAARAAGRDARTAGSNAAQSAALAASAADLQRNAGVTEAQVLALVSPYEPLQTQLLMSGWFAVLIELIMLLSAGGAADYIHGQWTGVKRTGTAPASPPPNVVELPHPSKTGRKQAGFALIDDGGDAPREPAAAAEITPHAPLVAIGAIAEQEEQKTLPGKRARGAIAESELRVSGRVTSGMLKAAIRHLQGGGKATQAALIAAGVCPRSAETATRLQAELERLGHIRREGKSFASLVEPKPVKARRSGGAA